MAFISSLHRVALDSYFIQIKSNQINSSKNVFVERGKLKDPEKISHSRQPTKAHIHFWSAHHIIIMPRPEIERRPHQWKTSTLNSAPTPHSYT